MAKEARKNGPRRFGTKPLLKTRTPSNEPWPTKPIEMDPGDCGPCHSKKQRVMGSEPYRNGSKGIGAKQNLKKKDGCPTKPVEMGPKYFGAKPFLKKILVAKDTCRNRSRDIGVKPCSNKKCWPRKPVELDPG